MITPQIVMLTMQTWQSVFLGAIGLPRELSAFELQAFFTFSGAERQLIEQRRASSLKLGLPLQIGFLRMSGHPLDAFRIVPANLWRHLGVQFNVDPPDLASLRALYRRGNALFEHQQLACQVLGFRWMTEHQQRYLVSLLREELERTNDRERLMLFARNWLYEHRLIIVHDRLLRKMIAASVQQFEAELAASIQARSTTRYLSVGARAWPASTVRDAANNFPQWP